METKKREQLSEEELKNVTGGSMEINDLCPESLGFDDLQKCLDSNKGLKKADVDLDGKVESYDALRILRFTTSK